MVTGDMGTVTGHGAVTGHRMVTGHMGQMVMDGYGSHGDCYRSRDGYGSCGECLVLSCVGTGKTLMARQIGKMLHAREPKIINGPGELMGPKYLTLRDSRIWVGGWVGGRVGRCFSGWLSPIIVPSNWLLTLFLCRDPQQVCW